MYSSTLSSTAGNGGKSSFCHSAVMPSCFDFLCCRKVKGAVACPANLDVEFPVNTEPNFNCLSGLPYQRAGADQLSAAVGFQHR